MRVVLGLNQSRLSTSTDQLRRGYNPTRERGNGISVLQLHSGCRETCRYERQVGDEENEQVVEPNEKEKQDSGKDHPDYLGRVGGGGDDERPPAPSRVVRGGRWSLAHCSLLTPMEMETNEERKAEIAIATEHRTMLAL